MRVGKGVEGRGKGVGIASYLELAPKSRSHAIMSLSSSNNEPVTHCTHNRRVTSELPNLMYGLVGIYYCSPLEFTTKPGWK